MDSTAHPARVAEYIARIRAMGTPNWFDPREFALNDEAVLELKPWHSDMVYLTALRVVEQRKGAGTRVMTLLTSVADEMGITMTLAASPLTVVNHPKIPKATLVAWYRRFGFTGPANKMVRTPTPRT